MEGPRANGFGLREITTSGESISFYHVNRQLWSGIAYTCIVDGPSNDAQERSIQSVNQEIQQVPDGVSQVVID